jgi:shikimate kinase
MYTFNYQFMIIVLLGYMASGKSTIGEILAVNLGYNFVDLDHYIEEREASSIAKLFANRGEIYFRKKESLYLNELINSEDNVVLSLGGGTPCYGHNMETILKSDKIISVYLKASISTIIKRLENEEDKRPLIAHLKSKDELTEFIGKHLFERSQYYNQARIVINTDSKDEHEIMEDIISQLF